MRRHIQIKKGRIENTMDKAMFIMLAVCIVLIVAMVSLAYIQYNKDMRPFIEGDFASIEQENIFKDRITEDGKIIIDGEIFIPSGEYSFKNYFEVGVGVLNSKIIDIGGQDKSVFKYNNIIIGLSGILFIYWIVLLLIYEKEKRRKCIYTPMTDEELFKKYSPLIAGCIEGSRRVVHSDIIATIFGLVNKKIINLKLVPINEEEKYYKYILSRNKKEEMKGQMDEVERYVHCWLFGESAFTRDEIDLAKFVDEIVERKDYEDKMNELQKIAEEKLHELGANKNKVPQGIRIINVLLFIFSIVLSAFVFIFGVMHLEIGSMQIIMMYFIIMAIGFLMPLVILLTYIFVVLLIQGTRIAKLFMDRFARRGVIGATISVAIFLILVLAISLTHSMPVAFIPYEILLSISFLIMKTDNLMIQNDDEIVVDYNRLKKLKEKIAGYTLLSEREIEDIKLWEEYMTYAVAFGVARNAINYTNKDLQKVNIDKGYLLDLVIDTAVAFKEVNF